MNIFYEIILLGLRKGWRGSGFFVKFFLRSKIKIRTKYNSLIWANPYQKIDSEVITKGYFDEDVYKAISSRLTKSSIYWDIGANIGLHIVTLKANFPFLTCYAFEPYCLPFSELVENVKLNNLDIKLYSMGVDHDYSIRAMFTTDGNIGATQFEGFENESSKKLNISAPSFSIDQLIEVFNLESPDIIKIDTEGNELNILKGAKNLLKTNTLKSIVFEANQNFHEIEDLLMSFNYEVKRLGEAPNFVATKIHS
jgi:FkbM family methyltransferase